MSVPAEQMQPQPANAGFFTPAVPEHLLRLKGLIASENVAADLEEGELSKIGQRCVDEYKSDLSTRSQWEKDCEEGIKLAKQVVEEKSWPWPNAANVKFPLLSEAAITFSARAYPEFVTGDIVKGEVTGNDQDGTKAARAARVSKFQTWQMKYRMPYWEEETDSLLVQLPLVGNVFRKVYKDPMQGAQARLVRAQDFVVNHQVKSLALARRETEILQIFGNEVEEKMRAGEWRRAPLSTDSKEGIPDADKPYQILEQHRWLDLDGDGYEEPYVVTVHETSGQVLRIVARFGEEDVTLNGDEVVRIEPIRHYVKYGFIPNPDGGLYDVGLCHLLLPVSESINTVLNQLLDAGTLSNTQGGLIAKGIRIKGGNFSIAPGEWKFVDSSGQKLGESIFPLPVREPSAVLFQLLGLLIDSGRSLANLKDVLQGNLPNANVPATTVLALIEQGQKVYSGIYKRIYRAMGAEFKAVYRINAQSANDPQFLQQYATVLDDPLARPDDFSQQDYDICPVADPTSSSQTQRLARVQVLMPLRGTPGMQDDAIVNEYLSAAGFTNPDRFYRPDEAKQAMAQQGEMQQRLAESELVRRNAEAAAKLQKTLAEVGEIKAKTIKALADAESAEAGAQMGAYVQQLVQLENQIRASVALMEGNSGPSGNPTVQGRVGGMEGAPGNAVVPVGAFAGAGNPAANLGGGQDPARVV